MAAPAEPAGHHHHHHQQHVPFDASSDADAEGEYDDDVGLQQVLAARAGSATYKSVNGGDVEVDAEGDEDEDAEGEEDEPIATVDFAAGAKVVEAEDEDADGEDDVVVELASDAESGEEDDAEGSVESSESEAGAEWEGESIEEAEADTAERNNCM